MLAPYRKFIMALAGAAVILATQIWGDAFGQELNKYITSVEALLVAIGVFTVRNSEG